jgi:hypothetical protein
MSTPADGRIFYVGKGKGRRASAHLRDVSDSHKAAAIRAIRRAGGEPRIEVLAHGLPNEEAAFRLEAAVIDLLGLPRLTNRVRGWRSTELGRMPLAQLVAAYRKKPVRIREPAILIRINQLYRPTMSPAELYDATRGCGRSARSVSTPGMRLPFSRALSERCTRSPPGCRPAAPSAFATSGESGHSVGGSL